MTGPCQEGGLSRRCDASEKFRYDAAHQSLQDMSKDISEIKSYSSDISRLQDMVSQNHALVKACTDTSKDVREIKNRFKDVTLHHHDSASLGVKVLAAKDSVWC